jgi:yecA family protein
MICCYIDDTLNLGEHAMISTNPASPKLSEPEALLASDRIRSRCFGFSELDGFLASIIIGPVWMSPRAWLPLIWGDAEPEWLDQDEANRICAAVRARHDQAAWQLAHNPDSYTPIFRTLPDGAVAADSWARGFMAGIGLHQADWAPLFRNPKAKSFVVPITAQLSDWDKKVMANCGREAVLSFRREGREFIGYCVAEIRRFWVKRRQASDRRRTVDHQPALI